MIVMWFIRNKYLILVGLIISVLWYGSWLYQDRKYQKLENERNTENIRQSIYADSLKKAVYTYSKQQLDDYIKANPTIKEIIEKEKIKPNRINNISTTDYKYKDNKPNTTIVPIQKTDPVTIKETTVPLLDSTSCLIIKGTVTIKQDSVIVSINSKEFKNKTTVIAYWERREWKFLGIKTRFLGKKQGTVKVIDECGESRIIEIQKKDD